MTAISDITISCVIPTCDRHEFIVEALQSIKQQTVHPVEVIIVDNGARRLGFVPMELNCPVKLVEAIPYMGVSQARNFGATLATGQFIAFLDDDDLWEAGYIEKVARAAAQGSRIILSRLDKLENGVVSAHKNPQGFLKYDVLFARNPGITGSNTVIEKRAFFELGGYDPFLTSGEDKALIIEAIRQRMPVTVLTDCQAIHRRHNHGDRLTSGYDKILLGYRRFFIKYKHLMSVRQRLRLLVRITKAYRKLVLRGV